MALLETRPKGIECNDIEAWFDWASEYVRTLGLETGACPFSISSDGRSLSEKGDTLWTIRDSGSLLAVAEWHAFRGWAKQLDERYVVTHAAVVEHDGEAILLVGKSGAGKSRLALTLVRRGFAYLGDEYAVYCPETCSIYPFPKALCLKNSASEDLSSLNPHFEVHPYPPDFSRRHSDLTCCLPNSGILPPPGAARRARAVILLQSGWKTTQPATMRRRQGLVELYRASWWRNGGRSFRLAATLARETVFWSLGRSDLESMADAIQDLVRAGYTA